MLVQCNKRTLTSYKIFNALICSYILCNTDLLNLHLLMIFFTPFYFYQHTFFMLVNYACNESSNESFVYLIVTPLKYVIPKHESLKLSNFTPYYIIV